MQVGSTNGLVAQLQAFESAAQGQYQSNQDFSFLLQQAANGSVTASSSAISSSNGPTGGGTTATNDTGYEMTGSFMAGSLIAVGFGGVGAQMTPYSPQQVQSEENAVSSMRQTAYSDALQNFITLSQQADVNGEMTASSLSEQEQFVGDNGLIAGGYDASFSIKPIGT